MKQRLTQNRVRGMTPGERTMAYFADHTGSGHKGPTLSLMAQIKFHENPAVAIDNWTHTLPRR